jgi:homopolymeric O-antigen transport system permease protein
VFQAKRQYGSVWAGAHELIEGVQQWRVWHLLGSGELRRRYARSKIGQFWLTISTGMFVATIGFVWANLWNMPIARMLPYVAVSYILWLFISGILGDATQAFIKNAPYFFNQKMTFSVAIYALAYRQVLVLGHNAVIIVITYIVFWQPVSWSALLALPGILLTTFISVLVAYLIAVVCTRYRDVGQIVESILQIAFFVTPVLWSVELLKEDVLWLIDYNPFAVFLSLVRDPLLGIVPPLERWTVALSMTLGVSVVALPAIGHYHRRIAYYL